MFPHTTSSLFLSKTVSAIVSEQSGKFQILGFSLLVNIPTVMNAFVRNNSNFKSNHSDPEGMLTFQWFCLWKRWAESKVAGRVTHLNWWLKHNIITDWRTECKTGIHWSLYFLMRLQLWPGCANNPTLVPVNPGSILGDQILLFFNTG